MKTAAQPLSRRLARGLLLTASRPMSIVLAIGLVTTSAMAAGPPYQVIYDFQGGQDGYSPLAALSADNQGHLYGTTAYGGTSGACPGQTA